MRENKLDSTTKDLIIAYIKKAENKLAVAKKLFNTKDYEDAVSRAYYSVFHAAQGLLLTEGQKAETHKGVVTLFGLLFIKSGKINKKFGKYITNLKDDRESGDYELFSFVDENTAKNALDEASEFLMESKTYLISIGIKNI